MKIHLILLALFLSAGAQSQNLDEIVKKHIEAIGGADKWNKLKTLRMEMKLKAQGSDIKINVAQIDRVAVRQDIEVMGMKGYSIMTQKEGWNFYPFQGQTKPEPVTQDELKNAQDDLNLRDEFITYKEL